MTTAKATEVEKKGPPPGSVRSINIQVVENGAIVSVERVPPEKKRASMECCAPWTPTPQRVFESAEDACDYVEECLGGAKGEGKE